MVLRLGRGETVTGMCMWETAPNHKALVVVTEQGTEVGRLLVILDTRKAGRHLTGTDNVTKLKLNKPVKAVQALDGRRLVVSVDYGLLVYDNCMTRRHCLSTSRTVTSISCKHGV